MSEIFCWKGSLKSSIHTYKKIINGPKCMIETSTSCKCNSVTNENAIVFCISSSHMFSQPQRKTAKNYSVYHMQIYLHVDIPAPAMVTIFWHLSLAIYLATPSNVTSSKKLSGGGSFEMPRARAKYFWSHSPKDKKICIHRFELAGLIKPETDIKYQFQASWDQRI